MESHFQLSDFHILQNLGEGSFSEVKLVKRKQDGKILALKQVKMNKISEEQKNMSLNQIRLLASIKSPFVISYEGSFFSNCTNTLCLLMQYADNRDLQAVLNQLAQKNRMKQGFPQDFIWKTVIQILQGLRTLHNNKIAHRDLKPANIFFGKGIAKIGDLNVSSRADSTFYKTKTGTPYYTAPQIWNGEKYTTNCDIWSLGCIIYEMCALLPPFRGENIPQLFNAIKGGIYKEIDNHYSKELKQFIRKCLTTDQFQRPSAEILLKESIIQQKFVDFQQSLIQSGKVELLKPLKCPKILKFVNSMLPKKQNKMKINESVKFEEMQQKQGSIDLNEDDKKSRKTESRIKIKSSIRIRSNKNIKGSCYPKSEMHINDDELTELEQQQKKKKAEQRLKVYSKQNISDEKHVKGIKTENFRLRSCKRIEDREKENIVRKLL